MVLKVGPLDQQHQHHWKPVRNANFWNKNRNFAGIGPAICVSTGDSDGKLKFGNDWYQSVQLWVHA